MATIAPSPLIAVGAFTLTLADGSGQQFLLEVDMATWAAGSRGCVPALSWTQQSEGP